MSTFRANIQTMLIGSLNTIKGVGIFAVASQLNLIGNIFHQSITLSARPLIAEIHDRNNREQLGHLYQATTKWSFTLNLPLILVMLIFPKQILSIFGKSFEEGALTLIILGFVNLVHVGSGMGGAIIDMTGFTKLKLVNSVVRVGLSIILNLLLIPSWGIVGAAVAALLLEIVSNLLPLTQIWYLFQSLPYNRSFLKPITAGLLAVAVSLAAQRFLFPASGLLETVLHMLLLLSVYVVLTLAFGLTADEQAVLTRFRRKAAGIFSRI
jgi:O-antigen/teichoic acid export membrane protein